LGCKEAMNFDGGGSATLWYDGQVRNSPCDRMEREIANCLVIVCKKQ
jgi:exopolysaccharide biosynthesis protein